MRCYRCALSGVACNIATPVPKREVNCNLQVAMGAQRVIYDHPIFQSACRFCTNRPADVRIICSSKTHKKPPDALRAVAAFFVCVVYTWWLHRQRWRQKDTFLSRSFGSSSQKCPQMDAYRSGSAAAGPATNHLPIRRLEPQNVEQGTLIVEVCRGDPRSKSDSLLALDCARGMVYFIQNTCAENRA